MKDSVLLSNNFLYSCNYEKKRGTEQFVSEHAFSYSLEGDAHFFTPDGLCIYKEGTIGVVKRNQLIKSLKIPAPGGDYRSVTVILDQQFLHRYALEKGIKGDTHYKGNPVLEIQPNAFIKGYFNSLLPYFEQPDQMTPSIAILKLHEAMELILNYCPVAKDLLFDFNEPFKIDLEAYMNKHYTFNVSLAQFSKLTGRSLATFKRDFQKIFDATPERWIQKKRLEHAHYLIEKKKQNPTDIYLEVGFENLSHFSTAFKKHYGYSPSKIGG